MHKDRSWLLSNGVKSLLLVMPLLFGLCFASLRLLLLIYSMLLIHSVLLGCGFRRLLLLKLCSQQIVLANLIHFILRCKGNFPLAFLHHLLSTLQLSTSETSGHPAIVALDQEWGWMLISLLLLTQLLLLFVLHTPN